MELWKLLAILGPAFFVSYQAVSKLLPKGTPVFLVNAWASVVGALIMFLIHLATSPNKSLSFGNSKTFFLAIIIGVLISLGNSMIIKAYSLGAAQSVFTSIFYPLLILYSVSVGLLIWHEKFNLMQGFGVLLSIAGLILVAYFKK